MSTEDTARASSSCRARSICSFSVRSPLGPAHGHSIAKAIQRGSDEVLQVEQGSLYPALHRLIKRGWIAFEDGTSENNRRAKFYRLTTVGRKQLLVETTKWDKLARAIGRILRPSRQENSA